MERTMSPVDVQEFLRLLVEVGDVYKVTDKFTIVNAAGEETGVKLGNKTVPIKIFHDMMKIGDHKILNPFVESLGEHAEISWFWQTRSALLGYMTKAMVDKIVELALKGDENTDVSKVEVVGEVADKVDDKTKDELDRIKPSDWASIFYHKKSRTAQLQSMVWDAEFRKEIGGKIRKKTWTLIENLMQTFFQTEDLPSVYTFKSDTVGLMEAEARLNVFVRACEALDTYAQSLLNTNLRVAELQAGLENLKAFHKACMWFMSPASKKIEEKTSAPALPWESRPVPGHTGIPVAAPAVPMNAVPAAVVLPAVGTMPVPMMQTSIVPMTAIPAVQAMPMMPMASPLLFSMPNPLGGVPLNAQAPGMLPFNK